MYCKVLLTSLRATHLARGAAVDHHAGFAPSAYRLSQVSGPAFEETIGQLPVSTYYILDTTRIGLVTVWNALSHSNDRVQSTPQFGCVQKTTRRTRLDRMIKLVAILRGIHTMIRAGIQNYKFGIVVAVAGTRPVLGAISREPIGPSALSAIKNGHSRDVLERHRDGPVEGEGLDMVHLAKIPTDFTCRWPCHSA